jgi:lysophospholipase L1-like esterase
MSSAFGSSGAAGALEAAAFARCAGAMAVSFVADFRLAVASHPLARASTAIAGKSTQAPIPARICAGEPFVDTMFGSLREQRRTRPQLAFALGSDVRGTQKDSRRGQKVPVRRGGRRLSSAAEGDVGVSEHRPWGVEGPSERAEGTRAIGKTACVLAVMALTLAVPYTTPRLRALRVTPAPWDPAPAAEAKNDPHDEPAPVAAPANGEQALPASENTPTINNALPAEAHAALQPVDTSVYGTLRRVPIEDPTGHALDAFFARLVRTDHHEAGAVTRILHYGDSVIASDYVSGTVRRRLQARFGDAGHGFILVANPWEWYFHNDVLHFTEGEWRASRLGGPTTPDGLYGLGGVSFTGYGGAAATFGAATHGDFGRKASRYDIYYLEQPGGGDIEVIVRGRPAERFSTRGPTKVSRIHAVHTDDGESRINVRAIGPVRLFGVAIERDEPGVIYDALGAHAAMASNWTRQNAAHWKEQFDLRDPALIVFQYGTNESDLAKLDPALYERTLSGVLDELAQAAPGASILVASPLDRAESRDGRLATRPVMFDLVNVQRRVALAHGVAFWNTFEAMGGEGSIVRWFRARPQLAGGDLTHPTPRGAEVLGDMLSDALMLAYEARPPARAP